MIAIVTSTLFPSEKFFEYKRLSFDCKERAAQTKQTVLSLKDAGFTEIYLIDNSEKQFHHNVHSMFECVNVNVLTFDNYPFNNRGISEALLILNSLKYLPMDVPLLKISGRYCLNHHFNKPGIMLADFIGKGFNFTRKNGVVSTRCYMVRNKYLLEQLMLKSLIVMNTYLSQIVGPRSLMKFLKHRLIQSEIPIETFISIEMGMAHVLKNSNLNVRLLDRMGLEGYVAGSGTKKEFLNE